MNRCKEKRRVCVPPHLKADGYALFVAELLTHADPEKVARQKAVEERINVPFRLIPGADFCQAVAATRTCETNHEKNGS